ncbi:MAG: hypothetical protein R3C41_03480 [Calditrichia bacterium]|nr:hypothetical protein [Calditrichia bacterium]
METSYQQKYWIIFVVILVIFIIVSLVFSPYTISYDISSIGRIIPAREWLIQRNTDGSLISSVKDHRTGFTENYFAVQVERGDVVHFQINPALKAKSGIAMGDKVGHIRSNEIERRLAELQGMLEMANASLEFYRTGEKDAVIREARQAAALSKEQAELQERLFERQKLLYDQQLISEETIEISQSASRISRLEAELASAKLQTVATGAKPEQLDLVKSEIERYKKEIRVLEDRLNQFTIHSTITGKIYKSFAADTLLMAGEEDFLLLIPVPWTERHAIGEGTKITVLQDGKEITGKIIRLNLNTGILNGNQMFTAIAAFDSPATELAPYLYCNCEIEGVQLTPLEYVGKYVQKMFSR